jgi:hypothetical protein
MAFSLAAMFERALTQIDDSRVKFSFVAFIENWRASPFASGRKLLVNTPARHSAGAFRSKIFFLFSGRAGSGFRMAMS